MYQFSMAPIFVSLLWYLGIDLLSERVNVPAKCQQRVTLICHPDNEERTNRRFIQDCLFYSW